MKKFIRNSIFYIFLLVPFFALAQTPLEQSTFKSLIEDVVSLIRILVPVLSALALLFFFWGLSKFILHSDNQANIEKGKSYMLWGILAIFILLSFTAIVTFISGEFGLGGDGGVVPYLRKG